MPGETPSGRDDMWRIFDAVPAMIWHKDAHNRILRLNRAAASTMGLPVTAIEGKSVYDLNPDYAEDYFEDDQRVVTTGQPITGIIEPLTTASGAKRWLRTDKIPYRDVTGEVTGLIVFAIDYTDEKITRDRIRALDETGLDLLDQIEPSEDQAEAWNAFQQLARLLTPPGAEIE